MYIFQPAAALAARWMNYKCFLIKKRVLLSLLYIEIIIIKNKNKSSNLFDVITKYKAARFFFLITDMSHWFYIVFSHIDANNPAKKKKV